MKAADAIWVAAARLQRERGAEADMSIAEIVERAAPFSSVSRVTLQTMTSQHVVASAKPNPDRYRMLTATGRGRRRLFRSGDEFDPGRTGAPTHPDRDALPVELKPLVDWYEDEYDGALDEDAMEELARFARESGVWKGINADEYVAGLRRGWD